MNDVLVPVNLLFAYERPSNAGGLAGTPQGGVALPLAALPGMQMATCALRRNGNVNGHCGHCLACDVCRSHGDPQALAREYRRKARPLRWGLSAGRPTVAAIENDRLIVEDDLESCCLAKALGKSWVKVGMPAEVHTRWLARRTDALDTVVARTSRNVFYNPVEHPSYRKAKVSRPDSIRLDRIRRLLGSLGRGLSGLDIGCNMGYTSHHLQRQGFQMTGIDFDEYHLAVARALNETYGLDVRFEHGYFKQFEAAGPFDVTVALTVLYHMLFRQEEQDVPEEGRMDQGATLAKLDALTRHALLWESGPDPDREIELIRTQTGLSDYRPLGSTEGTGKKRVLGVFLRPGTEIGQYLGRRCGMDSWDD